MLELMREGSLALELRVLVHELGLDLVARLVVVRDAARLVRGSADELLFEVLGAKDGDFGEEQLALDAVRVGVVEDSPDGDLGGANMSG